MTGQLEEYLRKQERETKNNRETAHTVPGIGPGGWDSNALARSQDTNAHAPLLTSKTVYRIYTENLDYNGVVNIIKRYFDGATITNGIGLDARTQGADERAIVIEIITSKRDQLQRIADLAGDIRAHNDQISVLVARSTVDTFEVTKS